MQLFRLVSMVKFQHEGIGFAAVYAGMTGKILMQTPMQFFPAGNGVECRTVFVDFCIALIMFRAVSFAARFALRMAKRLRLVLVTEIVFRLFLKTSTASYQKHPCSSLAHYTRRLARNARGNAQMQE